MIKTIGSNAWRGSLYDEETPRVALIKFSSNGLSGFDKQAFVKRASEATSEELLKKAAKMPIKPGEELLHVIALGSTESYGPNRNGDGFSKAACIKYHPTFVSDARWYRNHKNKDEGKSYGIVKASAYNPVMDRVELIAALNGTKQAAEANGGLVADKEMEKLASGEDIAVSMACAVPFDVCSCCGNRARSRDEYCKSHSEGGECEAGGLFSNIGKFASVRGSIKQLYADNTEPRFFDISNVFVPADRIAYSSGLVKKASYTFPGESYKYASEDYDPELPYEVELLQSIISDFQTADTHEKIASAGFCNRKPLTNTQVPAEYRCETVCKALSDLGVCLGPAQFMQLECQIPFEKAAKYAKLIGPISNSWITALRSNDVTNNPYTPAVGAPESLYNWAFSQRQPSTDPMQWVKQAALSSLERGNDEKVSLSELHEAGKSQKLLQLARNYALYKVAFLAGQPASRQESIATMLVARDYAPCVEES